VPTNSKLPRPTKEQLAAAVGGSTPDILTHNLNVVFCGINPSAYSAVVGHHFARPGNRFWPSLYGSGFTPRLLHPSEDKSLPQFGLGITNVASRATVAAADLFEGELEQGAEELRQKIAQYRPKYLAVLGISAYREGFKQPKAVLGLQELQIGDTKIYVLPNPSGLNAHYKPADLVRLFSEFREFVETHP
jgi:TDG/mug DNA glycosylase family protein